MLSENFDKKIKDAAEQYSPAFEEKSWDQMDLLLHKHLPEQKKDRRRFLILLLIAFLLGGGSFLLIDRMIENEEPLAGKQTERSTQPVITNPVIDVPASNDQPVTATNNYTEQNLPVVPRNTTAGGQHNRFLNLQNQVVIFKTTQPAIITLGSQPNQQPSENNDAVSEPQGQNNTVASKETEQTTTQPEAPKPIQPQKKNNFSSKLSFSVSAGPDISMVGVDNIGRFQVAYGAGIGYQLSPKLSLRTGFYSARKIYSAKPGDYDPPKEFWNWYPNLKNIDANCKVFEVPILLDYSFGKNKQWFVSGGFSSVIMKSEKYAYTYRPQYAQYDVTYTRLHKNENKHLFSMVSVSGGYTYPLSKKVSLRAEPYVKIPVTGIGYGKIKLNSGGILMSVAVSPFK